MPLPLAGERDGTWQALVAHASGGGEFPPPPVDTRYFVNIVVSGGPRLRRIGDTRRRRYTGNRFTPIVALCTPDRWISARGQRSARGHRPSISASATCSATHISAPPPSWAAISSQPGNRPCVPLRRAPGSRSCITSRSCSPYATNVSSAPAPSKQVACSPPRWPTCSGTKETTPFHARATYGDGCSASRELFWTMHVDVGVDPARSVVTVTVLGSNPDGTKTVRIDVTLVDVYGNKLGPGRAEDLPITGATGTRHRAGAG